MVARNPRVVQYFAALVVDHATVGWILLSVDERVEDTGDKRVTE